MNFWTHVGLNQFEFNGFALDEPFILSWVDLRLAYIHRRCLELLLSSFCPHLFRLVSAISSLPATICSRLLLLVVELSLLSLDKGHILRNADCPNCCSG